MHARRPGAGFGAVSRDEALRADLFFDDLFRPERPRLPPPAEHDPARDPVLRPGRVGPAVDGTVNQARLAIVSPSNALGVAGGIAALRARFLAAGHDVSIDFAPGEPSPGFDDEAHHRFAGTDAQRSAALLAGLFGANSAAVIASAGGHGATRLLDELKAHVEGLLSRAAPRLWPLRPRPERVLTPKRIVGFSDFTAVLLSAYSVMGWASLHGPMLCCLADAVSRDRLVRALTSAPGALDPGNVVDGDLRLVGPMPAEPLRGVLLGGNLSLVEALYGSPFFPSIQGGILFVEDLNESGRKIDRMIEGLKHRGAAAQARAVVVGQVRDSDASGEDVARLFQRSWNVPCVFGLPAGHGPVNHALWIGLEYELQFRAGARASLLLRP